MSQKVLANWLKALILLAAVGGALLYGIVLPNVGSRTVAKFPELAGWYWPWLLFLWGTAIPCCFVLWHGWKITCAVRRDESFTRENARRLGQVSLLAAIDTGYLFGGNVLFLLLSMNHPSVFLASMLICLGGLAVAVAAALLSHLVYKAALLREEADLTI
ncbi:MAG: DUF2975 domain-containing protein [Candidatus Merdivicinus sp.]|jgi:hypothetical protein